MRNIYSEILKIDFMQTRQMIKNYIFYSSALISYALSKFLRVKFALINSAHIFFR